MNTSKAHTITCSHCGDECLEDSFQYDDKAFCCNGCQTVYEILSQNELDDYYAIQDLPGIKINSKPNSRFDYLDDIETIERLVDFQDEKITKIQFYLPQIHCSACLWLLEHLYKLNEAILSSRVNFLKKECYLTFDHQKVSLREVVELLSLIGYEPNITLNQTEKERKRSVSKKLVYQIGLAGFAFGNIMLMSLPEYFGLDPESFNAFRPWFSWINLNLATPITIFSGQDYFKSAYRSISQKRLNIDVPIALGILVLFLRSSYEIIAKIGPGYFDSLCGLLFFLLLGKVFQEKVYHQLSFERDYRSYFPLSITQLKNGKETSIPLNKIKKGDKVLIRNGELVPVDAYLIKGKAKIDNSFATGESAPINKALGDKIYAGGRQVGEAIQLEVIHPLNQSKLTRLWSEYAEKEKSSATFSSMTDQISHWFTPVILLIALIAGGYHFFIGIGKAIEVFSAVLIVACPCALALAAPFTFGHATRWMGRQQCYLREAAVLEAMAKVNHIVFDKTGTLTVTQKEKANYVGKNLSPNECQAIYSLVSQSTHPLSQLIKTVLQPNTSIDSNLFEELEGKGIKGSVKQVNYRIGSKKWLLGERSNALASEVYIEKEGEILGFFTIQNTYREGLKEMLQRLTKKNRFTVISGDNDSEKNFLASIFPEKSKLLFNQTPKDKLEVVRSINQNKEHSMMVGDGLNDAGALREAEVGVSIAEDVNAFSPACDIIVHGSKFSQIPQFLTMAKAAKNIVIASFIISFLYNIIGLSYAVQGALSPVFAALLMPISSITVVGFVSLAVYVKGLQVSRV